MVTTRKKGRPPKAAKCARTSISFPPDLYETLERIAVQKKVSTAWVIREAAEQYVSDRLPLFSPLTAAGREQGL
jgi:predicted DNA-binding ribbon-helix-helix protein